MFTDKTTLEDLAIMHGDSMGAVIEKLNLATTSVGKARLEKNLSSPLPSLPAIHDMQKTITCIGNAIDFWPKRITNGTIMVIEKFFESPVDPIPEKASKWNSFFYKLLHGPDHSLAIYSTEHCIDLIKGIQEIKELLEKEGNPKPLKDCLEEIETVLQKSKLRSIRQHQKGLPAEQWLAVAAILRHHGKQEMKALMGLYAKLDSWYGMALSMRKFSLSFPDFEEGNEPLFHAEGLYHMLLDNPVTSEVDFSPQKNFLFLTGANMSGKSTFIKSIGIASFLAHTGMGVPARKLRLSYFDGLISNINVTDDITRGESYFFNEVKRIKSTISRVTDGGHWMVLMDELFKGTNMQDAMKCNLAIIEGLSRSKKSIFILSTHLFEMADEIKKHPNISYGCFRTDIKENKFVFHYSLQTGVSSDRIGYRILEQENVVKMLDRIE